MQKKTIAILTLGALLFSTQALAAPPAGKGKPQNLPKTSDISQVDTDFTPKGGPTPKTKPGAQPEFCRAHRQGQASGDHPALLDFCENYETPPGKAKSGDNSAKVSKQDKDKSDKKSKRQKRAKKAKENKDKAKSDDDSVKNSTQDKDKSDKKSKRQKKAEKAKENKSQKPTSDTKPNLIQQWEKWGQQKAEKAKENKSQKPTSDTKPNLIQQWEKWGQQKDKTDKNAFVEDSD